MTGRGQCVGTERPVEVFGIVRRLPMTINLVNGNLEAYELLEHAHDESTIMFFGLAKQRLEIAYNQLFAGCAEPAQRWPNKRIIGFVRQNDGVWTYSRRNGQFKSDAPSVAHDVRNKGDIILAPAFQPTQALPTSTFFRSRTAINF